MKLLTSLFSLFPLSWIGGFLFGQTPAISIPFSADFSFEAGSIHSYWGGLPVYALKKLDEDGREAITQFQITYGEKGIYVHFYGDEWNITTTAKSDFEDLFKGDVYEVFFQPDTTKSIYLEYEINANNHELVLLIPNYGGKFLGWTPWKYEGNRKIIKNTWLVKNPNPAIPLIWHAEIFFPYQIFSPLIQGKPAKGTIWKGNFYRLDYDTGKMVKWAWSPIVKSFHEYARYGVLVFE
jgi:hypothetical protein